MFVHGLTGSMDESIFYNGARFFEKKGFSSFRFNLYDDHADARKLHECDLKMHASDINQVVDYFRRKKTKEICLVGHSYGGPSVLFSRTEMYSGIVLWDPTMDPDIVYRKTIPDKIANGFIRQWSFKFILGNKMVAESRKFANFEDSAKNTFTPTKIILAQNGNAQSKNKAGFFKALGGSKEMVVFEKTGHTFSEEGAEERLFVETLKWFKKFKY
ncbi:MAG: hypothetical protein Q7U36_03085 [bacterium]|nr:hypothetical protein [bacterium]